MIIKRRPDCTASLTETHQRLPTALGTKSNLLTRACKAPHHLSFACQAPLSHPCSLGSRNTGFSRFLTHATLGAPHRALSLQFLLLLLFPEAFRGHLLVFQSQLKCQLPESLLPPAQRRQHSPSLTSAPPPLALLYLKWPYWFLSLLSASLAST